ncbi:conserved hypothetical protein [Ricinus communis]|uniref:Uncharacterized protein n=1 Tax=Ricinus communis TaxID=3988 RepID=B9TP30_RICCO|nr:conserved hypothetical protein [Ricinus communis]
MGHVQAGEDVRRLGGIAPAAQSVRIDEEISRTLVPHGPIGGVKHHQNVHGPVVPGLGQTGQRRGRAVGPDEIAVENIERAPAQKRQGVGDAAAGFQHLVLVDGGDVGAMGHMGLDLGGQPMAVDHDVGDADRVQMIQRAVQHGLARHADQGFGRGQRQGAHAGAQSGGQDHGVGRGGHGHSCEGMMRQSSGIWVSSHSARVARAGWAKAASSNRQTRGMCSR